MKFEFVNEEKINDYEERFKLLKSEIIECIGDNLYNYELLYNCRKSHEMGEKYSLDLIDWTDNTHINNDEYEEDEEYEIFFIYSQNLKPVIYFNNYKGDPIKLSDLSFEKNINILKNIKFLIEKKDEINSYR